MGQPINTTIVSMKILDSNTVARFRILATWTSDPSLVDAEGWLLLACGKKPAQIKKPEEGTFEIARSPIRRSLGRAGFWGELGNLLCLLPPLPRDVTFSSARAEKAEVVAVHTARHHRLSGV